MKFEKDTIANETLGSALQSKLIELGYELAEVKTATLDIKSKIESDMVMICLKPTNINKCRRDVISFLKSHGYIKRVSGSSGSVYFNFEDNSKRVGYEVCDCGYRDDSGNINDLIEIFLSFETK